MERREGRRVAVTSLMQFEGETGRRGVRLEFVLRDPAAPWNAAPVEPVECDRCERGPHERIHVAWRKPRGTLGQFVVFAYNGETHVPDLSIPIDVERIPRDAVALSDEETIERWHR